MATKVTLSLDSALIEEVRRLVKEGESKSQSAFFEEALRLKVRHSKREKRRQGWIEANKDPLFLADIEEVERDFAHADAEGARMIE